MIALGVGIAFLLMLLFIKFPRCLLYTMLALSVLSLFGLIVLVFMQGMIAMGVILLIVFVCAGCFLYCAKDQIKMGTILLQTASRFLK